MTASGGRASQHSKFQTLRAGTVKPNTLLSRPSCEWQRMAPIIEVGVKRARKSLGSTLVLHTPKIDAGFGLGLDGGALFYGFCRVRVWVMKDSAWA